MRISHWTNSFLTIDTSEMALVCDPWCGTANYGGWHSLPLLDSTEMTARLSHYKLIYISHVHSDHFSPHFLSQMDLSNKTFIIKDFKSKFLRDRILSLGAEKVLELAPWREFSIGNLDLVVVPQSSSSSNGTNIGYATDLDTSLLVRDRSTGCTLFNKVDNPLSKDELISVREFVKTQWNTVLDVTTVNVGAASEWPQCFPGLDRESERSRYVTSEILTIPKVMRWLAARAAIIAGGKYFIPGKFHPLNQYLALPEFMEIRDTLESRGYDSSVVLDLEGGGEFDVGRGELVVQGSSELRHPAELGQMMLSDRYDYELDRGNVSDSEIEMLFNAAAENFRKRLADLGIRLSGNLHFALYDDLRLDSDGNLDSRNDEILNLTVDCGSSEPEFSHFIRMDRAAMEAVLLNGFLLKQVLSGSLAIQERKPDVFRPGLQFALNWFKP